MNIRMIHHYMYCPRRYALLEINKDWSENAFVASADLMHEHVHDGSHCFSNSQKIVRSAVDVYNDLPEYDLYGILDCVEFVKDKNGVPIDGLQGTYKVCIIEYKPQAPKKYHTHSSSSQGTVLNFHETDAIQVFAQKICADFVWNCDSEAFLYYSDIRKRIALPFQEQYKTYDAMLRKYLHEMYTILENHDIPPRRKGQKCSGCSIADLCFPKQKKYNIRDIIMSMKGAEIS